MSKHTPYPWTEHPTPGPWIVVEKEVGGAYQIVNPEPGSLRVCTITNAPNDAHNAALIAAAPAMYEALKVALEAAKGQGWDCRGFDDGKTWHAQLAIKAAIFLAEKGK